MAISPWRGLGVSGLGILLALGGLTPAHAAPPLTLEAAVLEAVSHNPQVRAAEQALEAARQQVLQARAGLSPTVAAAASESVGNLIPSALPAPSLTSSGSVALTASVPLYDSGRTRVAVAQAEAAAAAAEAALQQARQDVGLQAASAFFSLLKAQRLATVSEAQLASAQALLAQTEARVRAGVAPRSDVAQAQAQVAQAEVTLLSARAQVAIAQGTLASVLGRSVETPVEVQEPPVPSIALPATPGPLLADAATRRPEVVAAQAGVASSRAALDQAVLNAGLQVTVGVDAAVVPVSTQGDPRSLAGVALTGTVSLPVLDGGRTAAAVAAARATLEAAQATLEQVRLTVRQDAYQAYQTLQQAQAALRATDAARVAAEEALRVAEGRYQAGVGSIVEVITARAQAVQAEVTAASAVYDYETAVVTLRHAAGLPVLGGSL